MVFWVVGFTGCEGEGTCSTTGDCEDFKDSVCRDGACTCRHDERDRCYCESQAHCDALHGTGARICDEGLCKGCLDDDDCGEVEICLRNECAAIECKQDEHCEIGYCNTESFDCVPCRSQADCPDPLRCREDGACVWCIDRSECGPDEICDFDVRFDGGEIVGTNQCGFDCGPTCAADCAGDPDCLDKPRCVVTDPDCLEGCQTWTDCPRLPESCEIRTLDCPGGETCEAIAQSIEKPLYYACLPTPCLVDIECPEGLTCYEGQCLPGCASDADCSDGKCVARTAFAGGACF